MLNPVHLLTVAAVVRTGSFAVAANELGYTPSAVSQQVAALERAAGVVLFERTARSIRPTPAAELLASRGTAAVAMLARLEGEVAEVARGDVRRLTVGLFPSAAPLFERWLRSDGEWRAHRAELRVEVAEPSRLLVMLAGQGALDAAVVYRFEDSVATWPPGLTAHHLVDEELEVVLRADDPRASLPRLAAADLDGAPWITHTPGTSGALSVERAMARAGINTVTVARCDEYPSTLALVRAGLGGALVPAGVLDVDGCASLARRRVPGLTAYRGLHALTRERDANPLVEALIRGLREAPAAGRAAGARPRPGG